MHFFQQAASLNLPILCKLKYYLAMIYLAELAGEARSTVAREGIDQIPTTRVSYPDPIALVVSRT